MRATIKDLEAMVSMRTGKQSCIEKCLQLGGKLRR